MSRMKGMPSHGMSLRSSVHFEQVGLGGSPGEGYILAMMPSKTPLWSITRNHPLGLPSSTFCQRPAADVGSKARTFGVAAAAIATTVATGSSHRNLEYVFRIFSPDQSTN